MLVRTTVFLVGIFLFAASTALPSSSTASARTHRLYVPLIAGGKLVVNPPKTSSPKPSPSPSPKPSPSSSPKPSPSPSPAPTGPAVNGTHVVRPGDDLRAAASALQPGQTLQLRGGVYDLGSSRLLIWLSGNSNGRVRMTSYPGERAVLRGLVRFEMSYASVDNITFEWGQGSSSDHMVKLVDGNDWVFESNEVRGAKSFACVQVGDAPKRWAIRNNSIHDCLGGNGNENQNHGIYADIPGSEAGLIEGNTIVNTPLGKSIKLGPSSQGSPGARNVTVRGNTMRQAARSVLSLSGVNIGNVVIEGNAMSDASESAVRFVWAEGDTSSIVVRNNQWSSTPALCNDVDSPIQCSQVVR